jgi:hypothetical protein
VVPLSYPSSPSASDFAKGFDATRRRGYPPQFGCDIAPKHNPHLRLRLGRHLRIHPRASPWSSAKADKNLGRNGESRPIINFLPLILSFQLLPAIGANHPVRLDDSLTRLACGDHRFATVRTVSEIQADPFTAVRANGRQFLFFLNCL